jgi:hypothetical protein
MAINPDYLTELEMYGGPPRRPRFIDRERLLAMVAANAARTRPHTTSGVADDFAESTGLLAEGPIQPRPAEPSLLSLIGSTFPRTAQWEHGALPYSALSLPAPGGSGIEAMPGRPPAEFVGRYGANEAGGSTPYVRPRGWGGQYGTWANPHPERFAVRGLHRGPGIRPEVEAGLGNVMPWTTPVDPRLGVTPHTTRTPYRPEDRQWPLRGPLSVGPVLGSGPGIRPAVERGLGNVEAGFGTVQAPWSSRISPAAPQAQSFWGRARDATSVFLHDAAAATRQAIMQAGVPGLALRALPVIAQIPFISQPLLDAAQQPITRGHRSLYQIPKPW